MSKQTRYTGGELLLGAFVFILILALAIQIFFRVTSL